MDFVQSIKYCLKNYATFGGRASRSEYWWFVLFTVIATLVASMFSELLSNLVSLALFVPSIAVGARRLHDIGKTGWFQLLWAVPLIGWALLIYWAVQPGEPGANVYGAGAAGGEVAVTGAPGQQ